MRGQLARRLFSHLHIVIPQLLDPLLKKLGRDRLLVLGRRIGERQHKNKGADHRSALGRRAM